jgi:hypothetical protein
MQVTSARHKVGIVVDRSYAQRIPDLARAFHVWVVESPQNTPVIEQFWKEECAGVDADPLESGITSFQADDAESDRMLCARIASDVDLHNGELAHDPPWSEIAVYGSALDDQLREAFSDLGATSFERTLEGFVCRR